MRTGPFRLANIIRVARNPRAVLGALSFVGQELNIRYYGAVERTGGCDIIKEDWDSLIILDGCRFDLFRDVNWLDGTLEQRTSLGSESLEYLQANFIGRELHDTVYVTTNPYAENIPDSTFHALINLLSTDWDDQLNTVPPDAVVESARTAAERFPNKRLIVHFMQPHYPFIGELGQEIDESGFSPDDAEDIRGDPPWRRLRYADPTLSENDVRMAYRENLRIVLESVEELLVALSGRTVITADHGNLIGDRLWPIPVRGYGHPRGLYVPGLVTVPWFIHDQGPRREVSADSPIKTRRLSDDQVEDRLEALGYR